MILQEEELNRYGSLYMEKHPYLKLRVVDGSALTVGEVLNYIPKGATHVLLRGNLNKVAYAIALALCQRRVPR